MAVFTGVVRADEMVVLRVAIFILAVDCSFILYLLYFFLLVLLVTHCHLFETGGHVNGIK